jgi:glycosyltransferase involved in cell wall biosynthesis
MAAMPTEREGRREVKLLLATDAWYPQVNGVVTTIDNVLKLLSKYGAEVRVISPTDFPRWSCPWYPEIEVALPRRDAIRNALDEFAPDAVHIFTEGTIGCSVRRECVTRGFPFTTSYHTRYPEYMKRWLGIPVGLSYPCFRRFHNAGSGCMVSTASMRAELASRGFNNIRMWTRGVDTAVFHPRPGLSWDLPKPVFVYVGRVSVEKNVAAFLSLELPGTKIVVGDGPDLPRLETLYPSAVFLGKLRGEALAEAYCKSDVFVFPSRTDTFGVVLLEAIACGLPVAAYPVTGPIDVVGDDTGRLDDDLRAAAMAAARMSKKDRIHESVRTWDHCIEQFVNNLEMVGDAPRRFRGSDRPRQSRAPVVLRT